METFLSIFYYLGTLSVFIVAILYPQNWIQYANRPDYELRNYGNYSIIVAPTSNTEDCYRIMNPYIANERLKFVNEINTWFVLFFTICDWIFMMICSIGAMIVFYKSQTSPNSIDKIKAHMFIEFLSIVSLLLISPLSYPSLIDNYEDCLDDNPFMRYDFFVFIQISFFIVVGFVCLQLVLFQNEEKLTKKYGNNLFYKLFFFIRNLNVLVLCGFFAVSIIITLGTNSWLALSTIVLDSGVGIYSIYRDALKNRRISDLLPINPKKFPSRDFE